VQALEARTRGLAQQAADLARLQAENAELRAQLATYGDWIRRLERRLEGR
jgi:cell division protein FtsB